MPIYEYECRGCNERFELLTSRTAAENAKSPRCVACGSRRTRRLMSTFVGRASGADSGSRSLGADACGSCTRSTCAGCSSA